MKKLATILILVVMGVVFGCSGSSKNSGPDWKEYYRSEGGVYYYDKQSVTYPSKGFVRVWIRVDFTEKGRNGTSLGRGIFSVEMNNIDNEGYFLSTTSYDIEGNKLFSKEEDKKNIFNSFDIRDKDTDKAWGFKSLSEIVFK